MPAPTGQLKKRRKQGRQKQSDKNRPYLPIVKPAQPARKCKKNDPENRPGKGKHTTFAKIKSTDLPNMGSEFRLRRMMRKKMRILFRGKFPKALILFFFRSLPI